MSFCNHCPKRNTCHEVCDEVEALLPKPWTGRDAIFTMPDASERVARMLEHRITVRVMLDHRDELTDAQRRVFDLYYNEGLSHRQIAEALKMRRNTVTEHMRRARLRIEAAIERNASQPSQAPTDAADDAETQ